MLNLSSIMLGSDNPGKLSTFYGQFLGKAQFEDGDWAGWQVGAGWLMVGPHKDLTGQNKAPARIMFNFESKDFQKEFERIRGTGADVVQAPYTPEGAPPDGKIATFSDPDGNYFQLMTPMEMA